MHQRRFKPHVMLTRIVSEDTYEELWNGASEAGALVFAKAYLRATRKVSHKDLRVVTYRGDNLWQSHKVGCFTYKDAEAYQPSLFA